MDAESRCCLVAAGAVSAGLPHSVGSSTAGEHCRGNALVSFIRGARVLPHRYLV